MGKKKKETIKSYCEGLLRNGVSRNQAWRDAQKKFPHLIVGWSYVIAISNTMLHGK